MTGCGVERSRILSFASLTLLIAAHAFASQQAADASRYIMHVRGELYRAFEGPQSTVFLVTPDGIILADPLNRAFAAWLREELQRQFPQTAVRYVVLSHHHYDRSEGASMFGDTAEIVAHANFNREANTARNTLAPELAALDTDANGRLERSEISKTSEFASLLNWDRNYDGTVTAEELYRSVPLAKSTFETQRTISLGGRNTDLVHVSAHTRDMIIMHFPSERVVFSVDHPFVGATPLSFGPFSPGEVTEWVRTVRPLDFDVILSGTGDDIPRAVIDSIAEYLDTLVSEVLDAHHSRRVVQDAQFSLALARYAADPRYAERDAHVAAAYRAIRTIDAPL